MDFCLDCGRVLRDLFCSTCKMIYLMEVDVSMSCRNCSRSMLVQGSSTRYRCEFCLYRYFAYGKYDHNYEQAVKEYISSIEKECPDCKNRMLINPANQELVCRTCGLVYEGPIYSEI